jgi:hypothetical protein
MMDKYNKSIYQSRGTGCDYDAVPDDLKKRRQWVHWNYEEHDGRQTKIPYDANTGKRASSTSPTGWTSFENAVARLNGHAGIGYVFSADDPFCGIDLDGCYNPDTGEIAPWARQWIDKLNSYSEISPSGTGIKVWTRAKWLLPTGKKLSIKEAAFVEGKEPGIEVYDHARYFCVTGKKLADYPAEPQERQESIDELCRAFFSEPARVSHREEVKASRSSIVERARKYVDTIPGAISGSGGHNTTFNVACVLVLGFGLTKPEALGLLSEYNRRCEPRWSDRELQHKIDSADKQEGHRGNLRDKQQSEWSRPPVPEYCEDEAALDASDDTDAISPNDSPKENQSKILVDLASPAELFHTAEGNVGYATIPVNDHHETWAIKSKTFRQWLSHRYYVLKHKPPTAQPLKDAIALLDARAQFEGREEETYIRIARTANSIYLDLTNKNWEVIEISADGWQILKESPVKFRRARGMLPLPYPTRGGNIDDLFRFANVAEGRDRILVIGAILQYFRSYGPYPIVVIHGGQGSAKSTTAKILKSMVDPNTAPLRSAPKDERDIMIAASNGWILAYDNLSHLPPWLSDILCRLATGGGFGTRELYTDADEVLFNAQRPVIINGIEEIAVRADFLDRAIIIYLPEIPEGKRRDEKRFWREFQDTVPGILGALLDAVCCAFRGEDAVELAEMPRMADFVRWVTAAEPAFGWESGTFILAYKANIEDANQLALEASHVAAEIIKFVECLTTEWKGTAKQLLETLTSAATPETTKQKSWPKTANWLSNALRRLQPNLEKEGVKVEFGRDNDQKRERWISLIKLPGELRPNRPNRPPKNAEQPVEDTSLKPADTQHANKKGRDFADESSSHNQVSIDLQIEEGTL